MEYKGTDQERKYIVACVKFGDYSAAACPCSGQIATNSRLIAEFLYRRWRKFSYKYYGSIAVSLYRRNEKGLYDAIKR